MKELERILREHATRYPRMAPTDAVKLIYQNEFGGGHMIRDRENCLNYLKREYAAVEKDAARPAAVEIGNGLIRAELAAVAEDALERLGDAFIASANRHRGSLPCFLEKLDILRRLTELGVFAFNQEELSEYLAGYESKGYPPVSHSEAYRAVYRPAYRVVLKTEYEPR